VTIVTAKGEVLQDKYLTNSYTSFIMPKEPVYIYVTVDGIDASVVFSSSLQLLSGIKLSRESGNSIFSKYQIRYNVDPGLRITNGEFQGSDWVSPAHPLYDRYFFPIEVRKNIWNNP
jgi:hypothetical protein